MTVTYKPIAGHPGYRVGDDGSVQTAWYRIGLGNGGGCRFAIGNLWKRLAPNPSTHGYLGVLLKPGPRRHSIHKLVLEAFVGPRPEGMEACHKDGNRTNNALSNLRWATHKENEKDKEQHGTRQRGEKAGRAKLTAEKVREIRARHQQGAVSLGRLAKEYGVTKSSISRLLSRQSWAHIT